MHFSTLFSLFDRDLATHCSRSFFPKVKFSRRMFMHETFNRMVNINGKKPKADAIYSLEDVCLYGMLDRTSMTF